MAADALRRVFALVPDGGPGTPALTQLHPECLSCAPPPPNETHVLQIFTPGEYIFIVINYAIA